VDRVPRDTQYLPHPSRGGSRGYDIHHRQMVVDSYRAGNPAPGGMLRSIQRWIVNGVIPFRMTGNKPSSDLSGEYLLLLVIFKFIWPQSNYCECIAFIANESDDARIFLEFEIGLALRKLGYTQKVTSTVAYQAFTQVNLDRRRLFWTRPWPVGIHGIPRRQLIDADEFGLHLNAANRKYGSAPVGLKIRKPGNYDRGTFKLTIILAVETGDPDIPAGVIGSVSNPRIWARVTTEPGTSAEAYRIFVEHVLDTYNVAENPALRRTLIHDNLTSHRAPEVYEAIRERGHRVVCRPPYRPQDGPVEYAINQVCLNLTKRWSKVTDLETMQTVVEEIIDNDITSIDETFLHCGFIWN
jgi:transposase